MSWDAVKLVINRGPRLGLDHFEFRVLLYLADRQNAKTGQLNPSPERLAIDCGLNDKTSERSIRRVIDRLEAKGLVERVGSRRGGQEPGGRYPTQQYRIRVDSRSPLNPISGSFRDSSTGGTHRPPLHDDRGDSQSEQGGLGVRNRGDSQSPEPRKLEPEKKNLPSSSTTRVASPLNGDATAARPNSSGGRISDDLFARVRELDPDAERKTRHDGSQYIELSDGEWLPNAHRAYAFTRWSREAQYG